MNASKLPFLFVSDPAGLATPQDFVLRVRRNIQTKMDLLSHYAKEGHFPDYFGGNWDALLDCLRDFSWASQKRIVLAHDDLPVASQEDELRVYLEILETAVNDWKEVRGGPFAEPPKEMPYVEHELVVGFPSSAESTVIRVLGARKT